MKLTNKQLRKIISETVRTRISESPYREAGEQERYELGAVPAQVTSKGRTPEIDEAAEILAHELAAHIAGDDHEILDELVTECVNIVHDAVDQCLELQQQ